MPLVVWCAFLSLPVCVEPGGYCGLVKQHTPAYLHSTLSTKIVEVSLQPVGKRALSDPWCLLCQQIQTHEIRERRWHCLFPPGGLG